MSKPQIVEGTVLFADCPTLEEVLLPLAVEKWGPIMEVLFSHYDLCIEKNDGRVVKRMGPTVMSLFIGPKHAERAWIAARMIVENAEIIGHGLPKTTQINAALNTGPVVAGEFGGKTSLFDVYGNTVNLAAQILGGYSGLVMAGEGTIAQLPRNVESEEWDRWGDLGIFNLPTRIEAEDETEELS